MPEEDKKEGKLDGGARTYVFESPKIFYDSGTINSVFQSKYTADIHLKFFNRQGGISGSFIYFFAATLLSLLPFVAMGVL